MNNNRINNNTYQFDVVRGLMCLMIFNRHFFSLFNKISLIPPKLISIISDSQVALFYFFILSGIVITLSFKREDSYPSLLFFSFKRILRLLPVIFIAILLGLIVCEAGWLYFKDLNQIQSLSNWSLSLYNFDSSPLLAFKDIFFALFCGFSNYDANFWTISYELYVPILLLVILRYFPSILNYKRVFLILLLSLVLLGVQISSLFMNTVYCLCFFIGYGIALYSNKLNINNRQTIILFMAIVVVCFIIPHYIYFRVGNPLRLIGVSSLLCLLFNHEFKFLRWLNEIKLVRTLGKVSFEIYAYHLVVLVSFSSYLALWLSRFLCYNWVVILTYLLSIIVVLLLSVLSSYLTKRYYNPLIGKILKRIHEES